MKKIYIAPKTKTIELGDELCTVGLGPSKEEKIETPGNDVVIPGGGGPGLGGDTEEEPA